MRGRSSMLVDRRLLLGAASFAAITTILQPTRLFAQGSSPTRIGIIGSGNIGGTIGGLWVKKGHSVFFSSRHPDELKDMVAKLGSLAQAGTVEQAVAFGDVLFIAVPYGAIPQIGKDYS
ncbi:MAG: NAD(P)-binding domain-containing protein, partial [Pseudolabrys sp.]